MAEAKGRKAKGTKRKRKAPAKRRKPKAEKRTPAEVKADGQAVAVDVAEEPPEVDPATLPWAHLPESLTVKETEQGRRPMSALEITHRNGQIFRGWLRGLRPETLAETYGLQPRAIEKIVAQWKEHGGSVIGADPMQIIEDHVLRLDAIVDELAAVAAKEKGGSGRVAAIRARLEAMTKKIEFLQQVKILPQDLGTIGVQIDLRAVGLLLYEALEKRGLAEPDLLDELADIIEGKRATDGSTIDLDEDGKPQLPVAA